MTEVPQPPVLLTEDDIEILDDTDTSLEGIFNLQTQLMQHFADVGMDMPKWPVDVTSKAGQRACRDTGLKAVEEVFELLRTFRNWKPHRQTADPDFDRDKFLEEFVDVLHYLFELCIFVGVGPVELAQAYERKNEVVHRRIEEGY